MRNPSSERLKAIIKHLGETQSSFAEKIGTSQSTIATAISRGSDLGGVLLGKILIAFPQVNISWLLTGIGNMLKDDDPKESTIRGRIKLFRDKFDISSAEVASKMHMPLKDIERYTTGESSPNIGFIKKFEKAYPSINIEWLLTGEGEMLRIQEPVVINELDIRKHRENKGISLAEIAEALNVDLDTIDYYEKGGSIPESKYRALCQYLNIGEDEGGIYTTKDYDEKGPEYRPRIPLNAAAGSLTHAMTGVTIDDCEQIPIISVFPDYDFTIFIKGDSMFPRYESGDEVACKRIDASHFLQWGKVHVLDTTQGVIIKRIYDAGDNIRCNSFNPDYSDFEVPKSEIFSISLVVGLLRV